MNLREFSRQPLRYRGGVYPLTKVERNAMIVAICSQRFAGKRRYPFTYVAALFGISIVRARAIYLKTGGAAARSRLRRRIAAYLA